ncbi:MAG: hypothetical protein KGJ80_17240 [Chloroflexota bacterium]|nr:hypothetical protein [Chloroflexota bacterium]
MSKLVLILSILALTGCVSSPLYLSTPTLTAGSNASNPMAITPSSASTVANPERTPTTAPLANASPTSNPTLRAAINPGATVAAPTQLKVLPFTPSDLGSKTYSSANLNVAINYPADWVAREAGTSVSFTSPQGALIQLSIVETGALSPQDFMNENQIPNTRCSLSTSTHGVRGRTCFDTIAFSYDAEFILKSAGGLERLLSLSTRDRAALPVFTAMVASVRPAQ